MRIPATDSKTASVHKMNGDWTLASGFYFGYGSGSSGTFVHSGGTFTLSKMPLYIGSTLKASYTAKMTINGGTVYANCPLSGSNRSVILGWKEKATGTAELTVSGTGRLVGSNHIWLGRGAAGRLNIEDDGEVVLSNGSVFFFGGQLAESDFNGNQTSLLYLNGGVLTVQSVGYGATHGKARMGMYFNGGTLRAVKDHDDFIAIQNHNNGRGNVRVLAPGGTIDTNGHTINVQQLLDPPGSGTSGDLVITGGGTYKQTGATKYNGRTIVDGNTTYIKNNESTNLKLVVKGGSAFQNAAALASRVAGASLTFEDGAKFVVDCDMGDFFTSAPTIDIQGALEISFADCPREGRLAIPILRITGSGTFPADILSRVTLAADAPAGMTLELSADQKPISYNYAAHDWCWTGEGDGLTFGDGANWLCGNVPGSSSDLLFVQAPATVENDIDDFSVASITFESGCMSTTIAGKKIEISGNGMIENKGDLPQTFAAPVTFPGAAHAKQKIYMKDQTLMNEGGRIVFAGGVTCLQWNLPYDNRMMCGHWNCTNSTIPCSTATNPRTTVYKNSSLVTRTVTSSQALYIMEGAAVTNETLNVDSLCVLSINAGELVVNGQISFPATSKDKWTFSNRAGQTVPRFKAQSVVLSGSYNASLGFDANSNANAPVDWYLGEGGLNVTGRSHFFMHHTGDVLNIHPWKSDTAINVPTGGSEYYALGLNRTGVALNFFTDDENGVARTITLNGTVWGASGSTVTVKGAGSVAVKGNQKLDAAISVADTATYAIDAGCTNGPGTVTVGAAATLKAVGAGRAEVGGLALVDGATLAFEFTDKAVAPVLAVAGGSGTVPSTVNVKVSSHDDLRPRGGAYALTSGVDFTGATVTCEDKPKWVKSVGVVGGDIVLTVKSNGLVILVK